jgi:hypothetical protein
MADIFLSFDWILTSIFLPENPAPQKTLLMDCGKQLLLYVDD